MRNISEYTLAFTANLFPAFFLFLFFLLSFQGRALQGYFNLKSANIFSIPDDIGSIPGKFWLALLAGGILGVITTILYLKLIKNNDLSETLPLLTFTPIFSMIVSPLMLGKGEIPNILGIMGIILIVAGAYMLNIKERKEGLLDPFRTLMKNRGSLLALILAFIYSVTSAFDKIGSSATSSLFWAFCLNSFVFIALIPMLIYRFKKSKTPIKNTADKKTILILLLISGLLGSLSVIFQMTAIQLTKIAYVISIKRTGIILAVFLGYLFFKEKNIKERLLASATMVLGAILIAVS